MRTPDAARLRRSTLARRISKRLLRLAVAATSLTTSLTSLVTIATLQTGASWALGDDQPAMFAGGPARDGRSDAEVGTNIGRQRWQVQTDGPVRSTAVVHDGTVFVGSDDGRLYAIDLQRGDVLWTNEIGDRITAAPLVTDDHIFVASHDARVVALGRHDGARRWSVDLGSAHPFPWGQEGWDYLGSSPLLVGDTLVVGAADGRVLALDASNGAERWTTSTQGRIRSSPALAGDLVVIGSADGVLRALEPTTGAEVWRFVTRGADLDSSAFGFDRRTINGAAAVAGDSLYVGSRDARLYALDAATGAERWSFDDDGDSAWVIATPTLVDDLVVVGRSSSAKVQALDAGNGTLRWEFEAGGPVFSSGTLASGQMLLSTGAGELLSLDPRSGDLNWRRRFGAPSYATPAVADRIVVIGADDGIVRAFDTGNAPSPTAAVFWDGALDDALFAGRGDRKRPLHDALVRRGYRSLDAESLAPFLADRATAGAASVVVMVTDSLPKALVEQGAPAPVLQRYLERGGKIVWLGIPPRWLLRDEETDRIQADIDRASRFTGVEQAEWVSDSRHLRATPEGRRWALPDWWMGPGGVDPANVDSVLATDPEGLASAWVKDYGGPAGTGWVHLPLPVDTSVEVVARSAEAGILRDL